MICGIGTDITDVRRFKKWIDNPEICSRFFNPKELGFMQHGSDISKQMPLAARFAAKEAFSKALGTGITGFDLKEVYIVNDESGKPELIAEGKALQILLDKFGGCNMHVSLSHEKDYSIAFVILETKSSDK